MHRPQHTHAHAKPDMRTFADFLSAALSAAGLAALSAGLAAAGLAFAFFLSDISICVWDSAQVCVRVCLGGWKRKGVSRCEREGVRVR